jgi:hypothetical protein
MRGIVAKRGTIAYAKPQFHHKDTKDTEKSKGYAESSLVDEVFFGNIFPVR